MGTFTNNIYANRPRSSSSLHAHRSRPKSCAKSTWLTNEFGVEVEFWVTLSYYYNTIGIKITTTTVIWSFSFQKRKPARGLVYYTHQCQLYGNAVS